MKPLLRKIFFWDASASSIPCHAVEMRVKLLLV